VEITEVRIKLMDDPNERLLGFCSVTLDGWFVIRDLKIIQGTKGPFVAMPSRKLTDRCPRCGTKNHLRAHFCNECGVELDEDRAIKDSDGRAKLYADIAHPINSTCRDSIQKKVSDAWDKERILATLPGYICTYDDYGEDRVAKLKHPNRSFNTLQDSHRPDNTNPQTRRVEPAQSHIPRPHITNKPQIPTSIETEEALPDSNGFSSGVSVN
jgi:stage V sporulation protein G